MEINIGQIKIKNPPDYLFNDSMIVNFKDFHSCLLRIYKLSYKGVFSLTFYYINSIPTKNLNHMNVDHDKDFLYLFLDDVDGHIEENDGIKYLGFTPTEKMKEALQNHKTIWEETLKAD